MKFNPREIADSIIQKFRSNSDLMKIIILPAAVLSVDLFLRLVVLGIDITDAGADMALLGVSTFIALIVEGVHKDDLPASFLFLLIFILMWSGCLKIVSLDKLQVSFISYDFRGVSSLFFGFTAFIFSSIFADSLIRNSRPKI